MAKDPREGRYTASAANIDRWVDVDGQRIPVDKNGDQIWDDLSLGVPLRQNESSSTPSAPSTPTIETAGTSSPPSNTTSDAAGGPNNTPKSSEGDTPTVPTVQSAEAKTTSTAGANPTSPGQQELAKQRIALFGDELKQDDVLRRLEFILDKEGGGAGILIFETLINRAHFSKILPLKQWIFGPSYPGGSKKGLYYKDLRKGDPGAVKLAPKVTRLTLNAIQRVIYGGENRTDLCTDQGYNDQNLFIKPFIDAGCTGSWWELKGEGVKVTDPGRIQKLNTTPGNGTVEFIYRKDGRGQNGSSPSGEAARAFKALWKLEPTSGPSTYQAGTPPSTDLANKSGLTDSPTSPLPEGSVPTTVANVDHHGATVVKNTNDCPKGMFTFPGVGAMVWVFFREGNPQFPVYFAASYSSAEWNGAYGGKSISSDGTNQGSVGSQTSNSLKFTPNAGGGLEFTHIKDSSDPSGTSDKAVAMMYGDDGSNMMFSKGYHQIYTRHDRRDQIDGHLFKITGGAHEEWVEYDKSENVRGNVIVKVGKINKESMEAMQELSDFSKQMNKMILDNPGNTSQ